MLYKLFYHLMEIEKNYSNTRNLKSKHLPVYLQFFILKRFNKAAASCSFSSALYCYFIDTFL